MRAPTFTATVVRMPTATPAGVACEVDILFDERNPDSEDYVITNSYSELANLLRAQGHTVDNLTSGTLGSDLLSEYDVLVLALPTVYYPTAEKDAILGFVQSGGRLVVIGEWGGYAGGTIRDILNDVLLSIGSGIAMNTDTVNNPTDNDGEYYWPIIHIFSTDAVNSGVSQVVEYAGASLTVGLPGYVTAWADEDSPVMAMVNIVRGDVWVVGDGGLFSNTDPDGDYTIALYEYDNERLALNVFAGLCPEPVTATVTVYPTMTPTRTATATSTPTPTPTATATPRPPFAPFPPIPPHPHHRGEDTAGAAVFRQAVAS